MKRPSKFAISDLPNEDGLYQVLVYEKDFDDYRVLAFDVMLKDARKIVKAMTAYEKGNLTKTEKSHFHDWVNCFDKHGRLICKKGFSYD